MPGSGDQEVMDRRKLQPTADTPHMPAGYLEPKRLPWSWARVRLERLGIVDRDGNLTSTELPADMLPDSDATLETG